MDRIKLQDIARVTGANLRTVQRLATEGIIRGQNYGRGRGRGRVLDREQAIEAVGVLALLGASVDLRALRPVLRDLRRRGWKGADLLALGSDGRALLLDGDGPEAPLRHPRTGQTVLFATVDLRGLREDIERLVCELEREAAKREGNPHAGTG